MAFYLISYDAHYERDYQPFYDAMVEYGGVSILESLWGLELTDDDATVVRDWVVSLLNQDDSIFVLKLRPKHSYATQELSKDARAWMSRMNGS